MMVDGIDGADPALLAALRTRIEAETGMALSFERLRDLHRSLARLAEQRQQEPAALLRAAIDDEPGALLAIEQLVTVPESYFFRTPEHFALVEDALHRWTEPRPIRMVSLGCARGEEAYSLAMVALGVFGEQARHRVSIIGADLNGSYLQDATWGTFRQWSLRTLPPHLHRWFNTQDDQSHQLADAVRELVTFREGNLLDLGWLKQQADILFCRNVLIYFSPVAIAKATRELVAALAPGGCLVTSFADPRMVSDQLEIVDRGDCWAYRLATSKPALLPERRASADIAPSRPARREVTSSSPSETTKVDEPHRLLAIAFAALEADAHERAEAAATQLLDAWSHLPATHLVSALHFVRRGDRARSVHAAERYLSLTSDEVPDAPLEGLASLTIQDGRAACRSVIRGTQPRDR